MLGQLGAVTFEIAPVNVTEISRQTEGGFVEKPILGRRPPLEFVGAGPQTMSLTVKLFPEHLGGLGSIDDIAAMQASGAPQYFMRGDGVPYGWFVVERFGEKNTYLGPNGVGRVIDVDLQLKRADAPSASDYFAVLSGLF